MNLIKVKPIFLALFLFIVILPSSFAGSQEDWKSWTQKLSERYKEKLATPSIAHYIYLTQPKESAFVDVSKRPRFVKKSCKTCPVKVTWTEKNKVLVQDLKSSRQMTFQIGQSGQLPWKQNLFFSSLEVDDLKRLRLFVHDLSDPHLSQKRQRQFMNYNPQFVRDAKWEWLTSPRSIKMQKSDGSSEKMSALAELHFQVKGEKQTLSVYDYGEKEKKVRQQDSVLLLFRDLSNGRQTYGAGRFMYLPVGKKVGEIKTGETIPLDFNYSYNPPCSVSEGFHCPLPQDFINLDIQAGEKYNKVY